MASKIKVDQIQTINGSGTIALQNQLSGLASASMPTGSVLQVVSTTKTDVFTASISTPTVITGLTVAITPSSTSNKILVSASVNGATGTSNRAYVGLRKGGAVLTQGDASGNRRRCHAQLQNDDAGTMNNVNMKHLDSPSTTSSITYQVYAIDEGGSTPININRSSDDGNGAGRGRGVSSITVMEIAG